MNTMRLHDKESVAHANIHVISQYAHLSPTHYRVTPVHLENGTTGYTVKTNTAIQRLFYRMFSTRAMTEYRRQEVLRAIRKSVTTISRLPPQKFVNESGEATQLFLDAQRFNQAIHAAHGTRRSIVSSFQRQIRNSDLQVQKELQAVDVQINTQDIHEEDRLDRPGQKPSGHLCYPNDNSNHTTEALRIFLLTQLERLAAAIFHIFTDRFNYFRGGLSEAHIRTDMAPVQIGATHPSSYWVGHSTCLISVPLLDKETGGSRTFNVLTDPIEGNLNAILYPRQTAPGRKVEEGPSIHVMLLSHNHLDHYNEKTIRKLLSVQPVMVVPQGDGHLFQSLGFIHVREQNWWDRIDLLFHDEAGGEYHMGITAVPSRHWAGQGPFKGSRSAFIGHILTGAEGGDIYYAGDTARLGADHLAKLRKQFNIRWMYQPGGPDERRSDMQSTHQSSADSLWMHAELLLKRKYLELSLDPSLDSLERPVDRQAFISACSDLCKTILMHTATFKLGNLHADDTIQSIDRVIKALANDEEATGLLKEYEQEVASLLLAVCDELTFADGGSLTPKELALILKETVYVPKIGSRIDFGEGKAAQQGRVQETPRNTNGPIILQKVL